MRKYYYIWLEGYSNATFLGIALGTDFKDACKTFMREYDKDNRYYNHEKNTYWACSLYDNEKDARKNYG